MNILTDLIPPISKFSIATREGVYRGVARNYLESNSKFSKMSATMIG